MMKYFVWPGIASSFYVLAKTVGVLIPIFIGMDRRAGA